jgi:hypothetical protein
VRVRKIKKGGVVLALVAGSAFFMLACTARTEISKELEEERITSPSGTLDAVLIRDDGGGAAGGWEWYVYIVAKGSPVDVKHSHPVFNAGTLTGEQLRWAEEHLLEIHYDIADINQFKNLWGSAEIQNAANEGKDEYLIEIQLSPSSKDSSLLTPNGRFRPKN